MNTLKVFWDVVLNETVESLSSSKTKQDKDTVASLNKLSSPMWIYLQDEILQNYYSKCEKKY